MAPDSTPPKHAAPKSKIAIARDTVGMGLLDCVAQPDMKRMRAYRLARVRAELQASATMRAACSTTRSTSAMPPAAGTWRSGLLHNATRYCYVPTEGPITLFDFHNCEHLADGLETIAEVRPARGWYYFNAGPRSEEIAKVWAAEILELIASSGGGNKRRRHRQAGAAGHQPPAAGRHPDLRRAGGAGAGALDQIGRRDRLHERLHLGLRGRHGQDARDAAARHDRERALVASASGEHRARAGNGSRRGCCRPAGAPIPGSRNRATASSAPASW